MYPGTIIEYDDRSDITSLPISEVRNRPLFLALFTSDKGPESWTRVHGNEFFNLFGQNISFSKHGQPLLQAAMTINAGGELLCKRLVSDNAALANIGIVASFVTVQKQATNDAGELLYLDEDGNITTEAEGNTPYMLTTKNIKYTLKSASNVKTLGEAYNAIYGGLAEGEYLLYVIGDNGRGTSKKRIKILPNYRVSKDLGYTLYTLYVYEGSTEIESFNFNVNAGLVVNGQNISLQSMIHANSKQIDCIENTVGMDSFVAALATAGGIDADTMYTYDVLFGKTNRGVDISGIGLDTTGIDLRYTYGQMLQSGTNGTFGEVPFANETEFTAQAVAALDGTFDPVIFNLDQYKLTACVDANYPDGVKRAIETLAMFREDFMYFRDQRFGKTSVELISEACQVEARSMFCATYPQSYDIIDPYTRRQISVTIGYDLAIALVAHCDNGSILPTAGIRNNFVIRNAIYGTLSFAPTICPDPRGNQKEQLEDLRVNYASYIDNQLVVESLWTSQDKYSQWSFVNNVMGVQEIAKAIRTRCPAIRYTLLDDEDLERYKADVEEVIAPYRSAYKVLELQYVADATYSANKIFYAVLNVVYKDFIQSELFKITALSAEALIEA